MIDQNLLGAMVAAIRPPPIVTPVEFAETQIILPAASSAVPGALRLAPYQIEPVQLAADDETDTIVLQWASQTGKSTVINAVLGYGMAHNPGPMLHVSPTDERGREWVRERLDPLIASSPALRAIVGRGDKGSDSISLKTFAGGSLAFASSYRADSLAARAIKHLFMDEVDRFAASAGYEGSPIELALKRTKTFERNGRRVLITSTPTTRMSSRINHWFLRGDQRRWHVTCPDCGHCAPLEFENLKWEPGKPDTAHLSCDECGIVVDEAKRRTMIAQGKWVATATGEPGIRSYHLSELSSVFSTMASIVQSFEAAKTPEEKQVWFNTTLAQVFDAGTEVELSSSDLQNRAEQIAAPYRADIQYLTAGVDVQSDRLECTILATHADGTQSVLNHFRLPGDTSGDSVWSALDDVLGAVFPLANGRQLTVQATAVDSGFNADQVMRFVQAQRRKSRQAYATKGVSGFDRMPLARGGRLKGQMQLLLVGVDAVKHAVQKRLAMQEPGPGFIRLPAHLGPEYFDGLASEELRVRYVRGAPRHEYHRVHRQNEPLDCLIYATAITKVVATAQTKQPVEAGPDFSQLAASFAATLQSKH